MRIIGENIHILSPKVKEAVANRDSEVLPGVCRCGRLRPARGRWT